VEVLQRIQPLDFLLVVLWAGIVGWGLQTGFVRQLGMLLGVYVAAIASASLYKQAGGAVSLAFGREEQPRWEFLAYVVLFVAIFGLVGVIIWRAYPLSRISRKFGSDNLVGAILGAVWGVLLLIAVVTMLRYYAATPWRGQETAQLGIRGQVQASQVAPVLQIVLAPLWQVMTPWFPASVGTRL
jgi:uncharacterized membrane protein required for colicin V production